MRREALPKAERVREDADFTRILQEGRRLRGRYASVFWLPGRSDETEPNRAGVAAGKRLGKAAVRNRLKRRLREAYRKNKRILPCRGVSLILVASKRMIGRSADEVFADVVGLLERLADALRQSSESCGGSSSSTGSASPP